MQALREMPMPISWPLPVSELKPALDLTVAALHADMGVVLLRDARPDTSGSLVPVISVGLTDAQCAEVGTSRLGANPFLTAIADRRRIVFRDAWSSNDGVAVLARQIGFRGLEILPLCSVVAGQGDGMGAFVVMYRKRRGTNTRSVHLVECCAQIVVSAIFHARLHVAAEQATRDAEANARARADLVARMSHELRTPLQSIVGYIDLLRLDGAEPLTPTQALLLGRVRTSEQVLASVINDLIVFSQLEAGHVTYKLESVPAHEAMMLAQTVVAPLATERGVGLAIIACPTDTLAVADREKLTQVLVNLAANGVKFTRPGGTVELRCVADRDAVRFLVSDTGDGIPPERLADIFEPYVRLDTPRAGRVDGSGLGLAISREFAGAMGGELSVRSVVGQGSVFTLALRRASVDAPADAARARRITPVAEQHRAAS
ncbi:MAG TPA: HAMP domain-containing sensor histidine kinase [Gemmatimonadaceae bacterium]|jgi:signal transduction histidine kinase